MATSGRSEAGGATAHGSDEGFVRALGLFPATTVNMSQYLAYFHHMSGWQTKAVAVGLTVLTVALLYRRIESIANVVRFLWFGMILTVALVIIATATDFDPSLAFDFPKHAVSFSLGF